jgi:transcriptional accessory protein Tex/SPT6
MKNCKRKEAILKSIMEQQGAKNETLFAKIESFDLQELEDFIYL